MNATHLALEETPGEPTTHRKPMLLFVLSGLLLLLRFAARTLFQLLFQLPPRSIFRPGPTQRWWCTLPDTVSA